MAALVPAATEGLVREAIVVDGGSRDGTAAVADAAGCTIVEGEGGDGLARAASMARGDWLLFLAPGAQLEPMWQSEVVAFVDRMKLSGNGHLAAATFRLGLMDQGVGARIAEWTANAKARLFSSPRKEQGLVISRGFYRALDGHEAMSATPEAELARRIGARRLTLLRSRAMIRACLATGGRNALQVVVGRSFFRFRCSSRRGMISTKLHGGWRKSNWSARMPSHASRQAPGEPGRQKT